VDETLPVYCVSVIYKVLLVGRLMLMGGAGGLLDLMVEEGVAPDIKTMSILLQILNTRCVAPSRLQT
jgi:hypothetical protein